MTTTNADILIIGGRLYGCSTAYHLARNGARNIVVLERKAVSSGGTAKSGRHGRLSPGPFARATRDHCQVV